MLSCFSSLISLPCAFIPMLRLATFPPVLSIYRRACSGTRTTNMKESSRRGCHLAPQQPQNRASNCWRKTRPAPASDPPPPVLPTAHKTKYNRKTKKPDEAPVISRRLCPSPTIPRIPVHSWPLVGPPAPATVVVSSAAPSAPVVIRRPSPLRCERAVLLCEGYAAQTSSRRVVRRAYFVPHLVRCSVVSEESEGGRGNDRSARVVVGSWVGACERANACHLPRAESYAWNPWFVGIES